MDVSDCFFFRPTAQVTFNVLSFNRLTESRFQMPLNRPFQKVYIIGVRFYILLYEPKIGCVWKGWAPVCLISAMGYYANQAYLPP